MPDTFLSVDEIEKMTGLKRPHYQVLFLQQKLKIPAYKNAANQVVVYRRWIERDMDPPEPAAPMPDFAAMDEVA